MRRAGARAYRRGALRKGLRTVRAGAGLAPAASRDRRQRAPRDRRSARPARPAVQPRPDPAPHGLYREAARLAGDLGDEPRSAAWHATEHLRLRPRRLRGGQCLCRARPDHRGTDERPRASHHHLVPARDQPRRARQWSAPHGMPPRDSRRTRRGTGQAHRRPVRLALRPGLPWLSSAFAWLGDPDRAASYAERAVQAADESDHPYAQAIAYTWRVLPVVYRGDIEEASPLCEGAGTLCEQKELLGWLPLAYSTRGWILCLAGRPAEGLPLIERAIAMFEMVGFKAFLSLRYVEWAEGLLLAGRVDEARTAAQKGLELATAHGERGAAVFARCALGDIELAAGAGGAEVAQGALRGGAGGGRGHGADLVPRPLPLRPGPRRGARGRSGAGATSTWPPLLAFTARRAAGRGWHGSRPPAPSSTESAPLPFTRAAPSAPTFGLRSASVLSRLGRAAAALPPVPSMCSLRIRDPQREDAGDEQFASTRRPASMRTVR